MTANGTFVADAPGSIGNLGPGLDILGCAFTGACDTVRAHMRPEPGIVVEEPGHPDLPRDPTLHAAAIAAHAVLAMAGAENAGIVLNVTKGLPLCGGLGGSAASAVAGALAANALLGAPLDSAQLLLAALSAEERVAGRHADNVAPALLGGIVLVRTLDPLDVVQLPVPDVLRIVLVHPHQQLRTAESRSVLPAVVSREAAVAQAADVAAMVAALASGDLALLGRAMEDRIAEPARAPLLPGFLDAKHAALEAGALGCSISGAGPACFALTVEGTARPVAAAMVAAYARSGVPATSRIARVNTEGARLMEQRVESRV